MARAALQLGVRELAELVGVAPGTIVRIEAGKPSFGSTLDRLEAVFRAAGVECFTDEHGEFGVKLLAKRGATGRKRRPPSKRVQPTTVQK